jgi:transcriptional regulator with PAS, ATPase and Fis domain
MSDIPNIDWASELPSAITITDKDGIIVYMNNKSVETFANDGGRGLIGQNLLDCHNENSNHIIKNITDSKQPNVYTIEKKGIKKLIYQSPYFNDGVFAGLVEISIVLPDDMPHFNRDK